MRNIKAVFLLAAIIAAMGAGSSLSFAKDQVFSGTVHLRDGRVIEALSIESSWLQREQCTFTINGQEYAIAPENLASLHFVATNFSLTSPPRFGHLNGDSASNIEISLKNNRVALATHGCVIHEVFIAYADDFTGKVERQSFFIRGADDLRGEPADIIRIDFAESGSLMWSPASHIYFPPAYRFDPYHGVRLMPANPGAKDAPVASEEASWLMPDRGDR